MLKNILKRNLLPRRVQRIQKAPQQLPTGMFASATQLRCYTKRQMRGRNVSPSALRRYSDTGASAAMLNEEVILERYLVNDLNSGQVKVYTHDKSEQANQKVRSFFEKYSIPYTEINLSERDDSNMIQGALALHTGY